MQAVCRLWNTLYSSKFAISLLLKFCSFIKFYSHMKSYTPCTKAKAVCKPFDTDQGRSGLKVPGQKNKTTDRHEVKDGGFEEVRKLE